MENFRPGTAARLGLGYEELSGQNPRLIYASISGYGQTGPDAALPGYDAVAQALSGMMSVTGEADGEPVRAGTSLADVGAGMWALIGILAALHARDATGRGQLIDVSLLDGQVAWLTYVAGRYFATGVTPGRHGSAHESLVPYQVFPTADDPLMVAVGSDGLWRRFTAATGLEELTDDPRYATNPDRVRNRDTLIPRITEQRSPPAAAPSGPACWARPGCRPGRSTRFPPHSPSGRSPPARWWSRWSIRPRARSGCSAPRSSCRLSRPASAARRRCSASTPTRSWLRPGTRPTASPSCATRG